MSCKVVETSESLGEIFMCDYSNDSYWAVLSIGTVCYTVHALSFWVWMKTWRVPIQIKSTGALCCDTTSSLWVKSLSVTIQMKCTERNLPALMSLKLYKVRLSIWNPSVGRFKWKLWGGTVCDAITKWFYSLCLKNYPYKQMALRRTFRPLFSVFFFFFFAFEPVSDICINEIVIFIWTKLLLLAKIQMPFSINQRGVITQIYVGQVVFSI